MKSWKMRNGGIATVTLTNKGSAWPYRAVRVDGAKMMLSPDMRYNIDGSDSEFDLIEPVMRVYIAGPMTGIVDLNKPAFDDVASEYRKRGCFVFNPAEVESQDGIEWEGVMRQQIPHLLTCEMVVALPGWENSRRAQLELRIAADMGMAISWWEGGSKCPCDPSGSDGIKCPDPITGNCACDISNPLTESISIDPSKLAQGVRVGWVVGHGSIMLSDAEATLSRIRPYTADMQGWAVGHDSISFSIDAVATSPRIRPYTADMQDLADAS